MTPLGPPNTTSAPSLMQPSSPSPSPPTPLRAPPSSLQRQSKARLFQLSNVNPKETIIAPSASSFTLPATTVLAATPEASLAAVPFPPISPVPTMTSESIPELAGTKRRHAAMIMESSTSATSSPSVSNARRRTRTLRSSTVGALRESSSTQDQNHNHAQGGDAMDVEEDGRERKRVARR